MLTKKIFILISVLSLSLGLLLSFNDSFTANIITFLGNLLHRHLDAVFWKIGFERMGVELVLISVTLFMAILFYKKNPKLFTLVSCLSWILLFIIYVLQDSVNIPIADDYGHFLLFLNNYSSTSDFYQIFRQGSDSLLISMHLMSVFLFHLDAFNFRILLFISTICLIGNLILLYKSIRMDEQQKIFLFLILTILVFQFQYYDSIVWTSGALYHSGTIFFAFCSMYFLTKPSRWTFISAVVCSLLATLNCGNGSAALIAGMFLLIIQKRTTHLVVWTLFSLCTYLIYSANYSFQNEYILSHPAFTVLVYKIFKCIVFSFAFLGSPLQFLYQTTLPIILGGIIWLYFFILTLKKYYNKNPVIYFMLFFFLLTSMLPSLLRSNYRIQDAISIRYGIYSIMAIGCCIIAFFESIKPFPRSQKLLCCYFLAFSLLYHLSTNIFFYPEVVIRKEKLKTFMQKIKEGKPYILPPYTPDNAEIIIKESVQKNIYTIPE